MRGYGTVFGYTQKGTFPYTWSPRTFGPVWVGLCRDSVPVRGQFDKIFNVVVS